MMSVLDCADPSMLVDKRNQTISPLQALAMLNNQLTLVAAQHFAKRVEALADKPEQQIDIAWQMAVSRTPTDEEREVLQQHLQEFGLPSLCRMILNLNELVFAD
jgi:hypothetical protein